MDKHTKITLDEMIRRKEQIMAERQKIRTADLYIESLDGAITVKEPTAENLADFVKIDDNVESNKYLILQCTVEPDLKSKELQQAFGCVEPIEIVDKLFRIGEIGSIALEIMELAGGKNAVKIVKN